MDDENLTRAVTAFPTLRDRPRVPVSLGELADEAGPGI